MRVLRLPVHWVLLAPALLFVGAMALFPLGYSLILSFREWKLAKSNTAGDFVGLSNYTNLLTDDPDFFEAIRVTGMPVHIATTCAMSSSSTTGTFAACCACQSFHEAASTARLSRSDPSSSRQSASLAAIASFTRARRRPLSKIGPEMMTCPRKSRWRR